MVLVHFVENLSAHYDFSSLGPVSREQLWWLPVGFAAPLFTLLTGVSYRSWIAAQKDRGVDDYIISKRSVRRGLFLIGIGFAFNVFVWLPEDTFNWDILTFIGSALIILNLIRKLPTEVVLTGILLVAVLSPPLQVLSDYYAFWSNGYFEYDLTLSDLVTGYLATGYFPLFPWIIFPVTGFLIAPTLFTPSSNGTSGLRQSRFLLVGCVSIGCLVASFALQRFISLPPLISRWTMFPASSSYLLGVIGMALFSLLALNTIIDKNWKEDRGSIITRTAAQWCRIISKHSLSLYLLHHIVHLWPLWLYGLMTTGEPTAHWQNFLPVIISASLAIFFCILVVPLFVMVDKYHLPTVERIMRWIAD